MCWPAYLSGFGCSKISSGPPRSMWTLRPELRFLRVVPVGRATGEIRRESSHAEPVACHTGAGNSIPAPPKCLQNSGRIGRNPAEYRGLGVGVESVSHQPFSTKSRALNGFSDFGLIRCNSRRLHHFWRSAPPLRGGALRRLAYRPLHCARASSLAPFRGRPRLTRRSQMLKVT